MNTETITGTTANPAEAPVNYDFDTMPDRSSTYAIKWEVGDGEIPMWVADMDFQTAPEILEHLQERLSKGVFGYTCVPPRWYDAYISWWRDRHNYEIERDSLTFCTGIVPAIATIIRRLTAPADNVLLMTPVYNAFFKSITNNGRNALECPLDYIGGSYSVNWEELERMLALPQTTMMILCNPHNPIGRAWDSAILWRIGELCQNHNVTVISDEIHCDITDPGCDYIPFASVSSTCARISINLISPTKCFNIPGLKTAAAVVVDRGLREKIFRALSVEGLTEPGVFAVEGAIAAFEKGGPWLDEMRAHSRKNKDIAEKFIRDNLSQLYVLPSDSTYLLWIDCSSLTDDSVEFSEFLRREAKVYISNGTQYGSNGTQFLRMNVACPQSMLMEGLDRFRRGVEAWKNRS